MNHERMKALAKHLDKQGPETFNMDEWCGTACCIAGHAILIFPGEDTGSEMRDAGTALGLTDCEASDLFIATRDTRDGLTAQQGAQAVRNMSKYGEADWLHVVDQEGES